MAPGPGVKAYFAVWLALLLLLVLTFLAGDLLDVGRWNFVIALAIAAAKATLIGLFFMHIYYSPPLTRLVAVSGLFFLSILLGLALCDYATRAPQSPSGAQAPTGLLRQASAPWVSPGGSHGDAGCQDASAELVPLTTLARQKEHEHEPARPIQI